MYVHIKTIATQTQAHTANKQVHLKHTKMYALCGQHMKPLTYAGTKLVALLICWVERVLHKCSEYMNISGQLLKLTSNTDQCQQTATGATQQMYHQSNKT